MTTKRKTKAQKEAEEKAALRQRLTDIYSGAYGYPWVDGESYIRSGPLSRIIPACVGLLNDDHDIYQMVDHNISEYESVEKLTEFYYRLGVRA